MSAMDVSRSFVEGVWNQRDMSVIDRLCAPNIVNHDPTGDVVGIAGQHAFTQQYITAFPDIRVTIDRISADGDLVKYTITFIGTHTGPLGEAPATGKRATVRVNVTDRIENGKIAESWAEWDPADLMRQLGLA